jgi:hypothetical protein
MSILPYKRASVLALASCLGLMMLASIASAAPTVGFQAAFVPIPGFPDTGNLFDAGAALETNLYISGTEYGGYAPPLIGMSISLPTGAALQPTAFPTCPTATILTEREPSKCPTGSKAGVGTATGFVVFGGERVPEMMRLEPFWAPGGFNVFLEGHTPASIEVISTGKYTKLEAGNGYGPELVSQIPLIETVPGAPDGSLSSIRLRWGAALQSGIGTTYYLTTPSACPKGGFPVKAELEFAALGGLTEQTVGTLYKMPCPTESASQGPPLPPQTSVPGTGGAITAPSANVCLSRRDFTIHVIQIKGLVYREVSVEVNGHPVEAVRGSHISAPVDLRGLPKGRYTVRITVTATTGHKITGTRSYHTCAPKPITPHGNPRL